MRWAAMSRWAHVLLGTGAKGSSTAATNSAVRVVAAATAWRVRVKVSLGSMAVLPGRVAARPSGRSAPPCARPLSPPCRRPFAGRYAPADGNAPALHGRPAGRDPAARPADGGRRRPRGPPRQPQAARRAGHAGAGPPGQRGRAGRGTLARRRAGQRRRHRADAGQDVLDAEPCDLDIARFRSRVADGHRARQAGDPEEGAGRFREALALWRGPALADLAERGFARAAAIRLESARLDVAEDLADSELAAGRPDAALAAVEHLVPQHPYRERLRQLQMLALYRLGRQAEALGAYQDLRRTLAGDLGLEPGPAVRRLEAAILRQSPDLDGDSAAGPAVEAAPARALARHDALLRRAVADHGGDLFTHTGDGLGAVFPAVPAALQAAVAGQRELLRTAWSGSGPLHVRMAVHAGTAEARAGTFLGPTLNRTARLLGEADG